MNLMPLLTPETESPEPYKGKVTETKGKSCWLQSLVHIRASPPISEKAILASLISVFSGFKSSAVEMSIPVDSVPSHLTLGFFFAKLN